jgi:hypothetical protein
MNDLDIDNELVALVIDDKDTDATRALVEGRGQTRGEPRLVDDGKAGLDITRLGHGGDRAVLDVEHTVLLEDGAKHGLDDDARGRVGDEGRLLV